MKIYIATSWKNENLAKTVAQILRNDGHEVDCFCDPSSGRYVFHWTEFVEKEEDLKNYDAISFLNDPRTQRAFKEDKAYNEDPPGPNGPYAYNGGLCPCH